MESGKFEFLAKVREKSGNFRIKSRGWRSQVIKGINDKVALAVSSVRLLRKAATTLSLGKHSLLC